MNYYKLLKIVKYRALRQGSILRPNIRLWRLKISFCKLLGPRIVDAEPYSNHRVCPSVSKLYSSHIKSWLFNSSSLVDLHLLMPRPIKISKLANITTCFLVRNARRKFKNEMYLKQNNGPMVQLVITVQLLRFLKTNILCCENLNKCIQSFIYPIYN
jgi:hypothetical protein